MGGLYSFGCVLGGRFQPGFPGGSDGKESAHNVEDLGLIPGSGRSLGERNYNYSCILAQEISWTEEPGGL